MSIDVGRRRIEMKTASGASDSFAAVAMRPRAGVSELRSGLGGIAEGVKCGVLWLWISILSPIES